MAKPEKQPGATGTDAAAMLAPMMAVNPVLTRAWLDILSETTRFLAQRRQADLDTQKAMLACKDAGDLMQVQSRFFQTAIEQYSDEASRMSRMMSDAAGRVLQDARTGHARGYDDVPL